MYPINFTKKTKKNKKKNWLSLHYNKENSCLFVNGIDIHQFQSKDFEILANSLCLQNISKDWSVDNMKKIGLNGYVFDFSVDYHTIEVANILCIHKYLMKKNKIV